MREFENSTVNIAQVDLAERARESYTGIEELAESISTNGLLNPVTLVDKEKVEDWKWIDPDRLDKNKRYLLLAGGRRYYAHRKLQVEEIEGRIYAEVLTPEEIKTVEMEENLRRVDLTWQERIDLTDKIHEIQQQIHGKAVRGGGTNKGKGHSMKDTAKMLDKDPTSISKDVRLAKMMKKMPQLKDAKTKADAMKMLKKLKKDDDAKKNAEKIQKERKDTTLDKQRKALADSYLLMNFFDGIEKISDRSIDIIELDPPYAIDLKRQKKSHHTITDDYNEINEDEYIEFMTHTFMECYRVMKNHSWLLCWFGPDPWFSDLLRIMRETGFEVRGLPGIWSKGRGQTQQPTLYLANSYEMFFYARKGKPAIKKQGRPNVFNFPPVSPRSKIHPTERPIEMIQDILETFGDPGHKLMTPFAGSGNTILAGSNLGMQAFGYDLVETHKNNFINRVYADRPGKYKSYNRDDKE